MIAPMSKGEIKRIVLAYSGGLDTSVILRWLIETYAAGVVCYVGNVGPGGGLRARPKKALATGAVDCGVSDLRGEFVRDFAVPASTANARYARRYPLCT